MVETRQDKKVAKSMILLKNEFLFLFDLFCNNFGFLKYDDANASSGLVMTQLTHF